MGPNRVRQPARADLHIGSTAIHLAPETSLGVSSIDDRTVQLSLDQGSVSIRLRQLDPDQRFEVDTPNGAVILAGEGTYRIDASPSGDESIITVPAGSAEVTPAGAAAAFPLNAGQSARVLGAENPANELLNAAPPNEWDLWCQERDQREDGAESARYVGREMTGYEDLDQHGVWSELPPYGTVWTPSGVGPDWAPYRYGHWRWVAPWGWTWVDDASWGFAPFHYGRWAYAGAAWVWVPGARVARPAYSPALVVFAGGASFGAGVAWFPLGPREVRRPGFNSYVNQRVGFTAVPQETFVSAQPVHRAAIRVSEPDIMRAQAAAGPPVTVRPGRLVSRPVTPPPVRALSRQAPVVAPRAAPPARRPIEPRPTVERPRPAEPRPTEVERPRRAEPAPAPVPRPVEVRPQPREQKREEPKAAEKKSEPKRDEKRDERRPPPQ